MLNGPLVVAYVHRLSGLYSDSLHRRQLVSDSVSVGSFMVQYIPVSRHP